MLIPIGFKEMRTQMIFLSPGWATRVSKDLSLVLVVGSLISGCGTGATFNDPLPGIVAGADIGAKIDTSPPTIEPAAGPGGSPLTLCGYSYPPIDQRFVGLALSGGGARSAIFSAAVLFELQDLGLARKINVISGASGGALTAAYYAVTCENPNDAECKYALDGDDNIERRPWNRKDAYGRLSRDFIVRSLFRRIWPHNVIKTSFMAYDNTDIFADVLSDNLYDTQYRGRDLRFEDLSPRRPILVVEAADFTQNRKKNVFTFTKWDFDELGSNICPFKIGRAVAASSAYPGIFNYATLANYMDSTDDTGQLVINSEGNVVEPRYIHLFDAGARDNLALVGMFRAIKQLDVPSYSKITIFVIDAQNGFHGRTNRKDDPRKLIDHILDRNFYDVYDTLMESQYGSALSRLMSDLQGRGFVLGNNLNIYHIPLKALDPKFSGYDGSQKLFEPASDGPVTGEQRDGLLKMVNAIETGYGLEERDVACLAASAHVLVGDLRPKLEEEFGELLEPENVPIVDDLEACLSAGQDSVAFEIR